ncbi:MAG: sensor histidine kinase [Pseudomonadota bacterium]
MFSAWQLLFISLGYVLVLFAIAHWGDQRNSAGQRVVRHPAIYSLSIAVYCTSWTFYGSVGRATESGLGFLPIYLGPTLAFGLGWVFLRKILVIAKTQRITSIADFIAARYGKSPMVAGIAALIALVGVIPYIALQLQAVSTSIDVMIDAPIASASGLGAAFAVSVFLAAFAMLFGARQIDATEHHAGVVLAVAFESLLKLLAFLAVGIFAVYGLYDGFDDLFSHAAERPDLQRLLTFDAAATNWVTLTLLSAAAIVCLPRQFQVTIVENTDENHLRTAAWAFPLYLLAINVFVLPVALAGALRFPDGSVDPDAFVLALPLAEGSASLALLVFIGGLSAATAMVIMTTVAISIMVSNDLVLPIWLRARGAGSLQSNDISGTVLWIRRLSIAGVMLLSYLYFGRLDQSYGLVSIGLVSFAAVAQFAPVLLAALYWRGGTRRGAIAGLTAGAAVWAHTLFIPSFNGGEGLFEAAWLAPNALFGLTGLDPISHALFWSMLANIGAFVVVSLFDRQDAVERNQATLFVEAFSNTGEAPDDWVSADAPSTGALRRLAERFLGKDAAAKAFAEHELRRGGSIPSADVRADGETVRMVERRIAGVIGAASARVALASMIGSGQQTRDEILRVLDEATGAIAYGRRLEQKSQELELATNELQRANERLRELDKMKDEFLSTVTHELRTPLTAIRAFAELIHDEPDMAADTRTEYLSVITRETERLTRLINQVLDIAKIEAGRMDWEIEPLDLRDVANDAAQSMTGLFDAKGVPLRIETNGPAPVDGDKDKLAQAVLNLLSNALKFTPEGAGEVRLTVDTVATGVELRVADSGPGVPPESREEIFDRFQQARSEEGGNPTGTGLGLAITKLIIEHLGGAIRIDRSDATGSDFVFTLPARTA